MTATVTCTLTHAEHLATWKSWQDDCEPCGFGMLDPDQCDRGHPDDGVAFCGACGWDAVFNALRVGELSAICAKARTAGADLDALGIGGVIREFPLTEAERERVRRDLDEQGRRARTTWTPEARARFKAATGRPA